MEWKPKKVKYKRLHKGKIYPLTYRKQKASLAFGHYGLKVLKNARLNAKQLEASRRILSRAIRKKEKMWIRCMPNISFTTKPLGIRMGKGKGLVDEKNNWVYRLKGGTILFEVGFMSKSKAKGFITKAAKKLPVPSVIVSR
jgi:large subunit ribosomal protein L16